MNMFITSSLILLGDFLLNHMSRALPSSVPSQSLIELAKYSSVILSKGADLTWIAF
jgi:hypothetical protein